MKAPDLKENEREQRRVSVVELGFTLHEIWGLEAMNEKHKNDKMGRVGVQ